MLFGKGPKENQASKRDIFDEVKIDVFDLIDDPRFKGYIAPPKVVLALSDEIRSLIKSQLQAMVKEAIAEAVKGIKPRTVEVKTIERIVEKATPAVEKIIEKQVLDEAKLQKTIDEKISKGLDERPSLFIPAPPIIASMANQGGKVLSTDGSQSQWIARGPDPTLDIELTEPGVGLIVKTPNGTARYRIAVDNDGGITTEQLT